MPGFRFRRPGFWLVLLAACIAGGTSFVQAAPGGPFTVEVKPNPGTEKPVKVNEDFRLTFNRRANAPSVSAAFQFLMTQNAAGDAVTAPVPGLLDPNPSGRIFTFTPSVPLALGCRYELRLSTAAQDENGDPLEAPIAAPYRTPPLPGLPDVVVHPSGVRVLVPSGALAQGAYVRVSTFPSIQLESATRKLVENTGDPRRRPVGTLAVDLTAFTGDDVEVAGNFPAPMTVSLPYPDADADGVVDGTFPPIRAESLSLYWLDESRDAWVRLPSSRVDAAARLVAAETPHFTVFAAIGQSSTDLSQAHAFPVPLRLSSGNRSVTFSFLADETHIRVFTLSGDLVADLRETDGDGQMDWDLRNGAGETVAAGVYHYVLTSGSEVKRGKLVIIR